MKLLLYLTRIFIDTFGITHPSEEARTSAARYIGLLLLFLVLILGAVMSVAVRLLHR